MEDMMSMYAMVFGPSLTAPIVRLLLGEERWDSIGRKRDAWVEKTSEGRLRLHVYARNGGNNRSDYMPDWTTDELYLFDRDDSFDETYASTYFKVPDNWREILTAAGAPAEFELEKAAVDPIVTEDRWRQVLGA